MVELETRESETRELETRGSWASALLDYKGGRSKVLRY